tara:strand:- start:4975 stop:5778 length:804 start_codon:yes stop_codon:yes gene_type:complete
MSAFSLSDDLQFAGRLADVARSAILPFFRAATGVENKLGDGHFDPVTQADRASEAAMRALIQAERPGDGILGEEFPALASTNTRGWTLDPIDGTRGFICGMPTWTVLIAHTLNGCPRLGVIDQPFTGERFQGDGQAAWLDREGHNRQNLSVSRKTQLGEAILASTDPYLFSGTESVAFGSLRKAALLTRFGSDAYAYACLALGQIDLVVESGLQPFDVQALIPIVEGAGGIITNWRGDPAHLGGQVVAAASAELHARALEILGPAAL